jgi:hypothetical protein
MAIIRVPKPPKKAYNPRRRPGTLLQHQLMHLEWAARPAAERNPHLTKRWKPAKTEAEAARRIAALTERIHRQATEPQPPSRPAAKSRSAAKRAKKPATRTTKRRAGTRK